ncbi:FecR family protein [Rubripirellula amarantea]|uniref:FecR protein n=1 Tax=Rubripirellula amarantea TaxID=2527999 RepID=A0A5C5WTA9_9BACT|nr:FecR domain-containing protein [Rubripirellula amarantea]MDA8744563.1 FecR family protein [Rubripirellula amarantea]TWT53072.1 FecR protein [Rubripirellula amarantea]
MNSQDRFADLWTDFLEGELDDDGMASLRELLSTDDELLAKAADLYQTHRLLGLTVQEHSTQRNEFVRQTMSKLPANHGEFVGSVMSRVDRAGVSVERRLPVVRWLLAAAAVLVLLVGVSYWQSHDPVAVVDPPATSRVRLASASQARFFGELPPPVNSILSVGREYVLTGGLIEVAFPAGASAILEGPAVFRVTSDESLALDVGRCSVHAPDGAEGFRIDTPMTRVVDRGTRFSVSVAETSETEVHVIEGEADVYPLGRPEADSQKRLTDGQAGKFATEGAFDTVAVPFDASGYRRRLPDRVVSYQATTVDGGADLLTSVTVQRGGRSETIDVNDLIASRLTWFHSTTSVAFLCGREQLPDSRMEVASDRSLVTGAINPGGSVEPLTSDPEMLDTGGTPGMAIGFERPVRNGPGADVVFFDLQTFGNPMDGDAFHVSPLAFRDGLRSHTIRKYDLTMESPEAMELRSFHVHFTTEVADSLDSWNRLKTIPRKQTMRFRGLAVGIDLSDLGYAENESVEGLFLQDAMDDGNFVDPVFIGGLPALDPQMRDAR